MKNIQRVISARRDGQRRARSGITRCEALGHIVRWVGPYLICRNLFCSKLVVRVQEPQP